MKINAVISRIKDRGHLNENCSNYHDRLNGKTQLNDHGHFFWKYETFTRSSSNGHSRPYSLRVEMN